MCVCVCVYVCSYLCMCMLVHVGDTVDHASLGGRVRSGGGVGGGTF